MKQLKPRYIDLFSGAGGFSAGFKQANMECSLAIEVDKWAAETYRFNFPETNLIEKDIEAVTSDEINSLVESPPDLVVGGPPCQGFSHANIVNKDPKDPRNSLFKQFIRVVQHTQPKFCVIENVPALLKTKTSDGKKVIDVILKELTDSGYKPDYRLLDSYNFGVPQKRERLFIVGVKKAIWDDAENYFPGPSHGKSDTLDLFNGEPLKEPVTLWQAISDLPQYTSKEYDPEKTYICEPQNPFQKLMRRNSSGLLVNSEPMRHTARIVERFKSIGIGQSEGNVSAENSPRERGNSVNISQRKYSQNSRRQNPNEPCNAVVASSHSNFIHPYLHRNFTVREILRIQSFSDDFQLKGKRAVLSKKLSLKKGYLDDLYLDQRMQVGNAVPPLLAKAFGDNFCRILANLDQQNVA